MSSTLNYSHGNEAGNFRMAKRTNYSFQKRQKEIKKQEKKEQKLEKKRMKKEAAAEGE